MDVVCTLDFGLSQLDNGNTSTYLFVALIWYLVTLLSSGCCMFILSSYNSPTIYFRRLLHIDGSRSVNANGALGKLCLRPR